MLNRVEEGKHLTVGVQKASKFHALFIIVAGIAFALVFSLVTRGLASADSSESDAQSFGLHEQSQALVIEAKAPVFETEAEDDDSVQSLSFDEANLSDPAERDISKGIEEILAEEEAARIAAEQARIAAEQAAIAKAQAAKDAYYAKRGSMPVSDVDFSVGRDAFISEWTNRIDRYLAGSPLDGYGEVFATAAWENGVDPRWSPAISNTESSKGLNCFRWHNAWGWGQSSWDSWDSAIRSHVAGLANGYGFTISLGAAQKYCPPTYQSWYANTLSEMQKI